MRDFAQRVKVYYERGLWDETRVRNAAAKNAITADEFKEITGKDYSAE